MCGDHLVQDMVVMGDDGCWAFKGGNFGCHMRSSNNVKMQLLGGRKRVLIGRGGPGLAARNW